MNQPQYMLDTDTSSFFVKGRYPSIEQRLRQLDSWEYCISVITRAEMLYGLQLAAPTHASHMNVRRFLVSIEIRDWDQAAADAYAELRHALKLKGTTVDALDLMIAAHAVSIGAVLVTNNTKHFQHCTPWLHIVNWVTEP